MSSGKTFAQELREEVKGLKDELSQAESSNDELNEELQELQEYMIFSR